MSENIPDLTIEALDEESGLILLEQDSGGTLDRVAIHPLHVRRIAEKFGLAPSSNEHAARVIATLARRLNTLRERINVLDDMLWSVPVCPPGSAPTSDCIYSQATRELAGEFCTDLPRPAESPATEQRDAQGALDLAHSYFTIP